MKIIGTYPSKKSEDPTGQNIIVWPDSAQIRSRKPVFVPDGDYMIITGLGAQIKSVGKSIDTRYASRYYSQILPVVFLLEEKAAEKVMAEEDPAACEIVADYTAICGDTINSEELGSLMIKTEVSPLVEKEGEEDVRRNFLEMEDASLLLDEAISVASRKNTLKTGDIVARILRVSLPAEYNTILSVSFNDTLLLENKLK